ncbi:hypothetical protein [Pseudomonas sp. FG1]|uniref:hypothetical protein n=1 Tax=Pseudomonas sp. FG1 TaxID=3048624 RepID=UPI0039FD0060
MDVRQVLPVDSMKAKNEQFAQLSGFLSVPSPASQGVLEHVRENTHGVANNSEPLDKLMTLFTSFLTQLINLVSDNKEKPLPGISPSRPEVTTPVVPAPAPPKPEPAAMIAGLSKKRNGAKPDNIWSGFRQGPDGNCVTVSAIKAAMYQFGQSPTDIFKEVKKPSVVITWSCAMT